MIRFSWTMVLNKATFCMVHCYNVNSVVEEHFRHVIIDYSW